MDDHALVAMEAGLAGPLVPVELASDDEDDDLDLLDLGLPPREPMAEERLAAFAQHAAEARTPEALERLSEQAARVRVEAEHSTPNMQATDFGDAFVPDHVNQRSRFAELRTTARRFATAATVWQLAADQCREVLQAATRIGLSEAHTEPLKAEAADCAAQAKRQYILSHVTQAIWQVKELQLVRAPKRKTVAELVLRQANLNTLLERALGHCRSPELAGRPVLPEPVPAFDRELRFIDGSLRTVQQQRNELLDGRAQHLLRRHTSEGSHGGQRETEVGTSDAQSPAATRLAERDWQKHFTAKYDDLPEKSLALRDMLQGDGPGPLPMSIDALKADSAMVAAAANAEAISTLATQLEEGLALADNDEVIQQSMTVDTGGVPQSIAAPRAAVGPSLTPVLSAVLASVEAAHDRLVKGLVGKLSTQAPPRGEEARRLAERCARQQSRLLESAELNAVSGDRYASARLAAPLAALQQAFEALIPGGAGVPERLERAEHLRHAAQMARDIALLGESDQAADTQAVAEHCTRLRLDELAQAAMMDRWDAQQTYERLGEFSTNLLNRANDSAHDARDLFFGDPMPDEVQSTASGSSNMLRDDNDGELIDIGNRVAVDAMAAANLSATLPPDTPAVPLARHKAGKVQLQSLSFACKQAAAMVSILGDAERELRRAAPGQRSRVATQFAERVREAALASKALFTVLEDDNNGLGPVEVQRLRSGQLLNERTAELMRQNLIVVSQLFDARQYALELRQGLASLTETRMNARLDRLKEKFVQVDRTIQSAANRLLDLNGADPTPVHNVLRSAAMIENTFSELRERTRNEHNIVTAKIALENLRQCLAKIGNGVATPQVLSNFDYYVKSSQQQLKDINVYMVESLRDSENKLREANVPDADAFMAPRRRKVETLLRITIPMRQEFARYETEFKALVARSMSPSGDGAASRVFDGPPPADRSAKRSGRQKGGRR